MAQPPVGLDPDDPSVRTAVFGVQVTDWLEGPIGGFVMGRVRQRLSQLEQNLKKLDPAEPSLSLRLLAIQTEIKHWESFAGWIGDAIQAGAEAQAMIEGEQQREDA